MNVLEALAAMDAVERFVPTVASARASMAAGVREVARGTAIGRLSDDDLLATVGELAGLARAAEAGLIVLTGELAARSGGRGAGVGEPRAVREGDASVFLDRRLGCRDVPELVSRVAGVSRRTASGYVAASRPVRREDFVFGPPVAPFPELADALADGHLGLEGVLAATGPLVKAGALSEHVSRHAVLAADQALADAAAGRARHRTPNHEHHEHGEHHEHDEHGEHDELVDGRVVVAVPPVGVDGLRDEAREWAMRLRPDGDETREAEAQRRRGFSLGAARDGLVPVRGNLLPEVAAQVQTLLDAVLNPRHEGPRFAVDVTACRNPAGHGGDWYGTPACPPDAPCNAGNVSDTRSRYQRQHDAFATLVVAAARAGGLPTLGGAAPTLIVTTTIEELETGAGWTRVHGNDQPVPVGIAAQTACEATTEHVAFTPAGRILALSTTDRVFNHHQRKAILARDGGCVIPGCTVPAAWCELHHVREWAAGGPTHTDNGVALCWHHHRTLHVSGWAVDMRDGIPHVRAPEWIDPHRPWRHAGRRANTHRHRHRHAPQPEPGSEPGPGPRHAA